MFTNVLWQHVDLLIFLFILILITLMPLFLSFKSKAMQTYLVCGFFVLQGIVEIINLVSVHNELSSMIEGVAFYVNIFSYCMLIAYNLYFIQSYRIKHIKIIVFIYPAVVVVLALAQVSFKDMAFDILKIYTALIVLMSIFVIKKGKESGNENLDDRYKFLGYTIFIFMLGLFPLTDLIYLERLSIHNFTQITSNLYLLYYVKYTLKIIVSMVLVGALSSVVVNDNYMYIQVSSISSARKIKLVIPAFVCLLLLSGGTIIYLVSSMALTSVKGYIRAVAKIAIIPLDDEFKIKLANNDVEAFERTTQILRTIVDENDNIALPRIYLEQGGSLLVLTPKQSVTSDSIYVRSLDQEPVSVRKILSGQEVVSYEFPYVSFEGVYCSVFIPVKDINEKVVGVFSVNVTPEYWHGLLYARKTLMSGIFIFIGFVSSILVSTFQKSSMKEIVERINRTFLLQSLAHSRIGNWIYNAETGTSVWSDGMYEILKLPNTGKALYIGEMMDYFPPEDRENILRAFSESKEGKETQYTTPIIFEDDSRIYVHIRIKPVFDTKGKVTANIGIIQDITETMRFEEDRIFKQTLDGIDLLSVGFDIEGNVTYVNEAYTKQTGWTVEQLKFTKWSNHVLKDDNVNKMFLSIMERFSTGDATTLTQIKNYETIILSKDSEEFLISWTSKETHSSDGKINGILFIGENITEKRHLENLVKEKAIEAEKANKLKGQFLASISHELRTPLNSIIGFTTRVIKKANKILPEQQLENLNIVKQEAEHLLILINSLLDYSKLEERKMDIFIEQFDIVPVIKESLVMMESYKQDKPITMIVKLPSSDSVIISSDKLKVKQILINLLSNAIKYTEHGNVTTSLYVNDNKCFICVSDEGIGIDEENIKTIFDEFRQVDGSYTRKVGGTGLGLSIVKNLVTLLHGKIYVTSTVGAGSQFTIELPAEYKLEEIEHE